MNMIQTGVLVFLMAFLVAKATADQRMQTEGGFCHFILDPNDDDNEVFFANCLNSIKVINGGAEGTSYIAVEHRPAESTPVIEDTTFSFDNTGIECVMVDSNDTVYVSTDWDSSYRIQETQPRFGRIEYEPHASVTVVYELWCRNGVAQ